MAFDRSNEIQCAAVARTLWPLKSERDNVMRQLLQSVAFADQNAPRAWAVTLTEKHFRMNVGKTEVFVAGPHDFFINCAASLGVPPFTGGNVEAARYDLPQPLCRVRGVIQELGRLPAEVQQRHRDFIVLAGTKSSGKPFEGTSYSRSHSPGLIAFAEAAVGQSTSHPRLPERDSEEQLREDIADIEADSGLSMTTREALIQARLGQGGFRECLGEKFGWRCPVTDLQLRPALRASHIVPWKLATNEERLDPNNGLLLAANVDALFDRGLITFRPDGTLVVSQQVSSSERGKLGPLGNLRVRPTPEQAAYLRRHNELFVRDNS